MWARNPASGHISRETHGSKGYMHQNVHCSATYNSQDMKATLMSTNKYLDKEDTVYIRNGILLSLQKKNEILHLQQHRWTWRCTY